MCSTNMNFLMTQRTQGSASMSAPVRWWLMLSSPSPWSRAGSNEKTMNINAMEFVKACRWDQPRNSRAVAPPLGADHREAVQSNLMERSIHLRMGQRAAPERSFAACTTHFTRLQSYRPPAADRTETFRCSSRRNPRKSWCRVAHRGRPAIHRERPERSGLSTPRFGPA